MSQLMDRSTVVDNRRLGESLDSAHHSIDTFNYKPVPLTAPISFVLGLFSASAFVGASGVIVAFVGVVVGLIAYRKVVRSQGMLSGKRLALIGFALSALCFLGGAGLQAYAFQVEVPEGYQRVSFSQQISKVKTPLGTRGGQVVVHPTIGKYQNKQIFLKGYMYPQKRVAGITEFLLVKDAGECCFGGRPAQTDMIFIRMEEEPGIRYIKGRVAVAGTFRVSTSLPNITEESLQPIYMIDAIQVEAARTSF